MKRPTFILLLLILTCSFLLIGCSPSKGTSIKDIKSYREIPGLTAEEIEAVEALKESRTSLIYGAMLSIEAFITNEGKTDGFSVKFTDLLTRLFDIPFKLELFIWDDLVEGFASGAIDFTGELSSPNMILDQYYVTDPIKARYLRIMARESKIDDFVSATSIRGKTVGFLIGSTTEFAIRRAYDIEFTSIAVGSQAEAINLVNAGIIDAFIDESSADPVFEQYEAMQSKLFFPIISVPVSMSTANPALFPIITVINKYLEAGGIDVLNDLYEEGQTVYSIYKLFNSFTAEEKEYLETRMEEGETVKIAYESSNYPISFYNHNEKEFQGLAVDIIHEISRLTGLQFESVMEDGASWTDILEKLESGSGGVQIVTELLYTEAREGNFLWTFSPYSTSSYALISKSDYPDLAIHQVANARVGVLGNSSSEYLYRVIFPDNNNLITYGSFTGCIDAIEAGEIDLIISSEYKLLTFIHFYEKTNYKINIKLPVTLESHFGLSNNETILCSILSKAQEFVDTETMDMRWTSRSFDYNRKLVHQRVRLMLIFIIVVMVIFTATVALFINNIKLNKKLLQLANIDSLTNVYNRRHLLELIDFQLERTKRSNQDNYVMIYDLDHFKHINDNYGHLAGDKVLRVVAQTAKSALRAYDLLGRYGGEEFLVFVAELDKEVVLEIAERIRRAICAKPIPFEDYDIPISASIGVAQVLKDKKFAESIKLADEAMYIAKNTGRNRVVFHSS